MPQAVNQESEKSLYVRLGGYDVIAAIVDDLLTRMRNDPQFQRFGEGRSLDSRNRTRQLLVEQLCVLTGGPCVYIGRDMKTSHGGLGINDNDWEMCLRHTAAALDKLHIPPREKGEFVAIFERYKTDIVEQ